MRAVACPRYGGAMVSAGHVEKWHFVPLVGWQSASIASFRGQAKSADRLFGGAPRVSPRPSPEAIHIFPCPDYEAFGTSRGSSSLDPRPGGMSELLRNLFPCFRAKTREGCDGTADRSVRNFPLLLENSTPHHVGRPPHVGARRRSRFGKNVLAA